MHSPINKALALKQAKDTLYKKSLTRELSRIFEADAHHSVKITGMPVHYLLEAESPAQYEVALDTLLRALLSKNRLLSKHFFHFYIDGIFYHYSSSHYLTNEEQTLAKINDSFLRSIRGNTLVVSYGEFDDGGTFDQ